MVDFAYAFRQERARETLATSSSAYGKPKVFDSAASQGSSLPQPQRLIGFLVSSD